MRGKSAKEFYLESTTTTADPGLSSTIHLDPKQALAAELSRSTTTTTTTEVDSFFIALQNRQFNYKLG